MPIPIVLAGVAINAVRGAVTMGVKSKVKRQVRKMVAGKARGLKLPSFGKKKVVKVRRTRGMYMRKGRLFLGFSQKDIKSAMRRTYGGMRRRRSVN